MKSRKQNRRQLRKSRKASQKYSGGAGFDINEFKSGIANGQINSLKKQKIMSTGEGASRVSIEFDGLQLPPLFEISDTNFSEVGFEGTGLKDSKLTNMTFFNCYMKNTDFTGASLQNVMFVESSLFDTKFDGATLDKVVFYNVNPNHSESELPSFNNTKFNEVLFINCCNDVVNSMKSLIQDQSVQYLHTRSC